MDDFHIEDDRDGVVKPLIPGVYAIFGHGNALGIGEALETLILLLAPAAPHTADELWESIGKLGFTFLESWPAWDGDLARADSVTIAVQVNGKARDDDHEDHRGYVSEYLLYALCVGCRMQQETHRNGGKWGDSHGLGFCADFDG